jgi:hypothetical protein
MENVVLPVPLATFSFGDPFCYCLYMHMSLVHILTFLPCLNHSDGSALLDVISLDERLEGIRIRPLISFA